MSILNRRVTRKSAKSARPMTPASRLSAAVNAAVSTRTQFEGLETRTLFAAPTLTTITPFAGATEDTAYTITYAQLKAASDAADADGDAIKFRIEAVSSGTLKKGTTVVSAGATLVAAGDTLTWTPASNANGTLNAFTVKASDGTNLSSSAVQVQVAADAVNDAPAITSVNTLTGATEDTPYTITYAALAAAVQGGTDPDGDPLVFQFAAMSSGKLTKNGITVTAASPIQSILNPGETWVWTPGLNASGTLNAFTIKTNDGSLSSTTAAQVKVTVASANDAPTLTTVNTLTGASEDAPFTITYAQLAAASNIADADGTAAMFKIEALSGGTLTKGGVAIVAGTTTLATGESLVWTPASNVSGILPAFTVSAWDGTAGSSAGPVQVNVNVVAVNDAPVLSGIDTLTGAMEDSPYAISYEALVGATDVSDIDSTTIYFKIASVSAGGTLLIDDGINPQASVVAGTTLLKPGGVLYWVPPANANGSAQNAFTVKASDGQTDSSASVQVKVDVDSFADAPTLTTVSTLTGATEDTGYSITFANFLAAANEADADGDAVSFRIESITSGTLTKGGVTVVPGTTTFTTGDTLVWTPDANANGTLNAFTVRATDGTYYSSTAVQVKVTATAANDAPTLTNITTFGNGTEDTAYTITYAQLLAASDAADVDGGNVLFRVEAVSTGTLKKGTAAVVAGTTTIGPNESLTWTPAADANGILNAFTVKAYDGTAASSSAIQVKVGVAAVNDAPTLTAITNLTGATEDTTFTIDRAKLLAAANEADVDSSTINFQITSLGTGTLTLNGIPVSVGQVIDASTTLVWAPAANANGTAANALTAFSVKATDGALLSATAYPVKVDVANVNDAPNLSSINTLTGATEDTAYTITYAALNAASNATDIEGPVLFRIESITAGTLTKGGVVVTPGTTTLGTGESLVWTPAANVNGSGVSAFTVKAYDGTVASPSAVQVKVNINAVNDAPTLTSVSTLTGGTEDTAYPITYAALAAASNATDVDGTSPDFLITAVSSGTLTKNGVAVVANTTLISPGDTVIWTPAANANGSGASALSAFSVKVKDSVVTSATAVPVKVNVAAVNDSPNLTSFNNLTGASEDATFNITYAQLKAASNVTDAENDTITFRIEAVSSGTLTKGGVAVVPGTTVIAAGDTLVWTPAADAYGTGISGLPVMTVSAYDGNSYSAAPITVKADVANVNDAPTLTAITTFTTTDSATEDTPYVLTYAALAAAGDEADIDNSTILFRVEAISTGTLKKNGSAVTAGTTTLGPGESLTWTPAANANGTALTAFTVKAYDGAAASSTAIAVKFDVTAVNDAPSFSSATTLTGATEDTPFTINFADLATNASDPEGDAIQYKIMAVSSGTLTLNGTAVVPGTDVFTSGDVLEWTPDTDANGVLNAFTLIAGDGTDWSATPVQVKVDAAAANDGVPTYGSVAALTGATEDTPLTISYAQLVTATGLTDLDPEQTLTFRIESVVTGTLTKNGVVVTAGTTTLAAGESLVWIPAANASGAGLNAFTVKGYDGVGYSASPAAIDVDVTAVNDAPTLTSVTTLTGATEDTAFDIDFADLTTNAADADADTISYRVESVINGTLTIGGVAVTPGTTLFATGDTLQWTPSADANGTIGAFTLVATDGTLFSSTPVTVNVTVAATSDDPTLTAIATFTKGIENTPLTISYADLLAASDLKDADGGTVMFRIVTTDSGTLKKGGVTVVDGTDTLSPGESLVWTPAVNASGSAIGAFTVEAWDGTNASTGTVAVLVDVAHVAQMPTLTTVTTLTTNTATDTPTEDTAFSIDFAYFAAQTNAADPEGGAISYRIESVGSGTLTKGGVAVVPGVTLFSTGDTLVWTPAANANGSALTAFTVRASTAAGVSTAKVAVKVDVASANDTPTLTAISPLNLGAAEDQPINITYAQLLAASDAREVDSGDTLSFRIEAVSSGTLTKGGVAVDPGTDTIGPGEVLVWTPDADASGVLNAFTVKAFDGTAASASALQVKMNVNSINDAPTLTTFTPIAGATAGVAFNVTYTAIAAAGDQADAENGTINFVISKVLSGTLTKNGVAVIPGVTRIKAGDTLVWTSVANASGDTPAFSVFATDGQDVSSTAVNVVINVA